MSINAKTFLLDMAIVERVIVIYASLIISCGWALICPKCLHVQNVNLCGDEIDQCRDTEDVCIGTLNRWRISIGCGTNTKCRHGETHNTTDCSGNKPFGPRDRCTVCCTGHECNTEMRHIQQGLDKIANVLHCPVCHNERDPQKCLDNFVPCDKHYHTCEIQKHNGVITSRCYRNATECLNFHDNANRLNTPYCIGNGEKCRVCCNDHDCVDFTFGIKAPPTMEPVHVFGTSPTLTFSPPSTCSDQTLFPCHLAVGEACSDQDISTEFCRLTCGVCQAPSTTASTVHVTTRQTTTHITTANTPTMETTTTLARTHPVTATHGIHVTATHSSTTDVTNHHASHTTIAQSMSSITGAGCPDMWTQFDDSCYQLNSQKLTFVHAVEYCEANNGYLIELETAKEGTFFKAFMKDKTVQNGVWLGGNDIRFEGYFVWDKSETPLNFTDWYPGEPNQQTREEDCMSSWKREGYQWADHYCDRPDLGALCERPVTKCA